ncbi:MAG: DUF1667 domain-containing protein [Clostridia bacterium]|nr:DUF1667 domain-containing protein [Clostridia bacterium]
MKKELTCIICPRGCALTVTERDGEYVVSGNSCPRGEKYGVAETTHPTRTITTLVRVKNRVDTMLSVKTEEPIPKERIFDLMRLIRETQVLAPVKAGRVILADAFGTRVVATEDVD